jgi:integrase
MIKPLLTGCIYSIATIYGNIAIEKTGTFKLDNRIFPYKADSVGSGWRVTRQKLIDEGKNLEHIVFHDLRSHGITTLIKEGWDISKVAVVSGHTNLDVLHRIYARIRAEDVVQEYEEREAKKREEIKKLKNSSEKK